MRCTLRAPLALLETSVQQLLSERPGAEGAPPVAQVQQPGPAAERLEELRGLLDRGLIDEADYERKKAAILDAL